MTWLRIAWAVDPWGALCRAVLLLACILHNCGCATMIWPAACPLEDGERRCTGRVWRETLMPHPTKPRPACRVGYSIDGVPLPVTVDAEDCGP